MPIIGIYNLLAGEIEIIFGENIEEGMKKSHRKL